MCIGALSAKSCESETEGVASHLFLYKQVFQEMMAAPEYPPRLKVENRWVRKCAVLQVCFGQQ